jgi:hypothetical protein
VEKGLALIESLPGAAVHILRRPAEKVEAIESGRFKQFKDTEVNP